MIITMKVHGFKDVPYLETSLLMQAHPNGLFFSFEKPNVIVGPNGSGKSACLKALSMETLSYFTGQSTFDRHFIYPVREHFWDHQHSWDDGTIFLQGLECAHDSSATLYYRPNHIPGNDVSPTHAMMCGYSKESAVYRDLTRDKSSGQQSKALQQRVFDVMAGADLEYQYAEWSWGKGPVKPDSRYYSGQAPARAEALKARYANPGKWPTVLMDEPEQSLDAKEEAYLWNFIRVIDPARVQVIVATHSLYPILHPQHFNIIETVPGYVDEVRSLLE